GIQPDGVLHPGCPSAYPVTSRIPHVGDDGRVLARAVDRRWRRCRAGAIRRGTATSSGTGGDAGRRRATGGTVRSGETVTDQPAPRDEIGRVLVVIPTYNEAENIREITGR